MVEVIRKGPAQLVERPLQAECGQCRSVLRFTVAEARQEPDSADGDALVIDCPECGVEVWVPFDLARLCARTG